MRQPLAVRWALIGSVALFGAIAIAPVVFMLGSTAFVDGRLDPAAYRDVLTEGRQWALLGNTVALGGMATLGALVLGLPYAYFLARWEFPLRRLFSVVYVIPLLCPPLILAWGWTRMPEWLLLGDLKGMPGTAFVFAVCYYPFVTMFATRSFRSIDAGLEEAAVLSGGRLLALRRVTLRLALPAILSGSLLVFLFSISDFALPDFVSTLGPKLNVYAGEIFFRAKRLGSSAEATAASVPLVALTGAALLMILRLRGHRPTTAVAGDFRAAPRRRPGRAVALAATGWCSLVIGISVAGPFGTLLAKAGSLENYKKAITNPGARSDILTSLGSSATAATAMTLLGFALALTIVSWRRRHHAARAGILEAVVLLPLAVPALMMGVGLIRIWNRPTPFFDAVYTSQAIVVLVCIARYLPFPVLALESSLSRIDPSLDEAGALSGASWARRLGRISWPLLRHGFSAAWILAFVFSMRELDTMVLLPSGNESLAFRVFNEVHFGRDPEIASICLILVFLIALPPVLYSLVTTRGVDPFRDPTVPAPTGGDQKSE